MLIFHVIGSHVRPSESIYLVDNSRWVRTKHHHKADVDMRINLATNTKVAVKRSFYVQMGTPTV